MFVCDTILADGLEFDFVKGLQNSISSKAFDLVKPCSAEAMPKVFLESGNGFSLLFLALLRETFTTLTGNWTEHKSMLMTVSEIIARIVEGNNQFTSTHDCDYFESFKLKQEPFITLVTCSDSRVPLRALLPDTSNKIFSIQNIGNQILSTEGSVDYGIYHLKTPVLMFLGHSDCGAIKAYLKGFNEESDGIKHELDFLRPIIHEFGTDKDFSSMHAHVIEKNLDYQVSIARKKYRQLVDDGILTIVAAYYDFRGEFGKGMGKIVFVNLNKHKTPEELRNLPEFTELSEEEKDHFIGRLPGGEGGVRG